MGTMFGGSREMVRSMQWGGGKVEGSLSYTLSLCFPIVKSAG